MSPRKLSERKIRAKNIIQILKKLFPDAKMVLRYGTHWELLVAVILSAQCTDRRVKFFTEKIFKKYRKLEDYVRVQPKEFEKDIFSTGFYRNKTKNILAAAKMVKERFGGEISMNMDEILTIPGVARKTANVVLGNAYGIVEGIAVDTHVRRLSIKLGLTDYTDPNKIEQDLMKIVPKKDWFLFTYLIIEYGRNVCPARRHDCINHPLTKIYPKAANIWP